MRFERLLPTLLLPTQLLPTQLLPTLLLPTQLLPILLLPLRQPLKTTSLGTRLLPTLLPPTLLQPTQLLPTLLLSLQFVVKNPILSQVIQLCRIEARHITTNQPYHNEWCLVDPPWIYHRPCFVYNIHCYPRKQLLEYLDPKKAKLLFLSQWVLVGVFLTKIKYFWL